MQEFRFRPLTAEDAPAICTWRYPPPHDFYSYSLSSKGAAAQLLRPENNYHAILTDAGELFGFLCFGPEAQMAGWKYDNNALDFGLGLAPHFTGRGLGLPCMRAVMHYLNEGDEQRPLRATVIAWNRPANRLCSQAGFQEVASFQSPAAGWFRVWLRNPLAQVM